MNRTTIAAMGVLAIVVAMGVGWVLAQPEVDADEASVVQAPDRTPLRATELPPDAPSLPEAITATADQPLFADGIDAETLAEALPPIPPPLVVHVAHADGRAAAGGRVALYDWQDRRVAEGQLDGSGSWTREGIDDQLKLFVLGLTPVPARFHLPAGWGEHQLTLPGGATLEGHVLIQGAPPERPFPLALVGAPGEYLMFKEHDERPSSAQTPGEVTSALRRGGFFTAPDGHFLLSGFESGTELDLRWPRFYHQDASHPAAFPVTVPASGLVLALRRPPMIRGRIVTADGYGAADARLDVELRFERQEPLVRTDGPLVASQQTLTFTDMAVDSEGRFAIATGDQFLSTKLPADPVSLRAASLAMQLTAGTPDASWVRVDLPNVDLTRDHDLGDLPLQPAQRVVLEVVDPKGAPIPAARVRPESDRIQDRSLIRETGLDGRVEIDLAVATKGYATIVAPGYGMAVIELPTHALSEDPLRVVLTPCASIHLRLRGPWGQTPPDEKPWRFSYLISAPGGVFDDSTHPALPGGETRRGPDTLRERPGGSMGASGSSVFGDGTVRFEWTRHEAEWLLEAVRPGHPLLIQVEIFSCPESFGKPPPGFVWESAGISLTAGEQREILVDLRGLQPGD